MGALVHEGFNSNYCRLSPTQAPWYWSLTIIAAEQPFPSSTRAQEFSHAHPWETIQECFKNKFNFQIPYLWPETTTGMKAVSSRKIVFVPVSLPFPISHASSDEEWRLCSVSTFRSVRQEFFPAAVVVVVILIVGWYWCKSECDQLQLRKNFFLWKSNSHEILI